MRTAARRRPRRGPRSPRARSTATRSGGRGRARGKFWTPGPRNRASAAGARRLANLRPGVAGLAGAGAALPPPAPTRLTAKAALWAACVQDCRWLPLCPREPGSQACLMEYRSWESKVQPLVQSARKPTGSHRLSSALSCWVCLGVGGFALSATSRASPWHSLPEGRLRSRHVPTDPHPHRQDRRPAPGPVSADRARPMPSCLPATLQGHCRWTLRPSRTMVGTERGSPRLGATQLARAWPQFRTRCLGSQRLHPEPRGRRHQAGACVGRGVTRGARGQGRPCGNSPHPHT